MFSVYIYAYGSNPIEQILLEYNAHKKDFAIIICMGLQEKVPKNYFIIQTLFIKFDQPVLLRQ